MTEANERFVEALRDLAKEQGFSTRSIFNGEYLLKEVSWEDREDLCYDPRHYKILAHDREITFTFKLIPTITAGSAREYARKKKYDADGTVEDERRELPASHKQLTRGE